MDTCVCSVGEQLRLDFAEQLKLRLGKLSISTVEVNVDEKDKVRIIMLLSFFSFLFTLLPSSLLSFALND